ncbi:sacsin N-terminal ATP-binding-like domain-containing protein [Kaistella yonginensis]|uniref:sacsin N-terminal ATP-binding-like domain-containing protein n=1 Tax=Kaistella yonginensis TaxID=658267 RepID=UPI0025B30A62|nr:hypothetical protein [Kaistella yonginensis]MDN3605855.1 hypothetical protein [Kaistella yonginensis]
MMKNDLLDLIVKEKENKADTYVKKYAEMVADYQREIETVMGYNGRQILELLQNCDDQESKIAVLQINTLTKEFSISNNGIPFSATGYRSLFIANLSSKVNNKKFIGNKGLGFRSIINWSETIEIISNNLSLLYSPELITDFYSSNFSAEKQINIRNEFQLSDDEIPVALLSMPEIQLAASHDYATTVKIKYREDEQDKILEQINLISSDILLFLNHLEEILIIIDNREVVFKKAILNTDVTNGITVTTQSINDVVWKVYGVEKKIDKDIVKSDKDKDLYYQVKIAIANAFTHTNPYLFSFFPTNIKFNQDYILHATFELDSTRNQIVDSDKNRFLLKEIVDFTLNVAKIQSSDGVNFNALRILNYSDKADVLDKYGYYELIEEALETEEIYPCLDNVYRKMAEIIHVNDFLPELLMKYNAIEYLPIHTISINGDLEVQKIFENQEVDKDLSLITDLEEVVNKISALNLRPAERIDFIDTVTANIDKNKRYKFNFLIDDEGIIINSNENIYTRPSNSNKLIVPSFTHIKAVNEVFYHRYLNKNYNPTAGSRTRFFYDVFKSYCNIHEYDIVPLINRIISKTNEIMVDKAITFEVKKIRLQESIAAIYANYNQLKDKETDREINDLNVLTKTNAFKPISNLFLSETYPSGILTAKIFDGIYFNNVYIADVKILLGETDVYDIADFEEFLKWMGCNLLLKYQERSIEDSPGYGTQFNEIPYIKYVRDKTNDRDNYTGYKINFKELDQNIISNLDIHSLIALCVLDTQLNNQISDRKNSDSYKYSYRGWSKKYEHPSYMKFQINNAFNFESFILDEKFSWMNTVFFDYNHQIFKDLKIGPSAVKGILADLGAIENFEESPLEILNSAFHQFNEVFPDGKGSATFYNNMVKILAKRNYFLEAPIKLFAYKNTTLELLDQDKIYFSDNNIIPAQLSDDYPILNFPSRAGAKEAIKRLNINDLDDLEIEIENYDLNATVNEEMLRYYDSIKPYILAYRLEALDKNSSINANINFTNSFKFILCNHLECRLNDRIFNLQNNSYVYDSSRKIYLLKTSNVSSLEEFRNDPGFADVFSDVLCNVFSTKSEKSTFESLIRDSSKVINYNLEKTLGITALEEAKRHLGQLSSKKYFWNIIFSLLDTNIENTDEAIDDFIKSRFSGFEMDLDYHHFNNPKNISQFKALFETLNISLQDFNALVIEQIDVSDYNFRALENEYLKFNNKFKQLVYHQLLDKALNEKSQLIDYFNRYNNLITELKTLAHENSYTYIEDSKQFFFSLVSGSFHEFNFDLEIHDLDINEIFKNSKSEFTGDENLRIRQNAAWQSLLFFAEIEIVRQELEAKLPASEIAIESDTDDADGLTMTTAEVTTLSASMYKTTQLKKSIYSKNTYKGDSKDSSGLKIIGNNAEDIAYNTLVALYTEEYVQYKAAENEALHYDLAYSKDQGITWTYVDVKNSSSGKFYISEPERLFGLAHRENYDIWIYINKNFRVLEKFFLATPILNSTEYEVQLDFILENND